MSATKATINSQSEKPSLGVKIKAHRSYLKNDSATRGLTLIYCSDKENVDNSSLLKDRLGPKLKISQKSESKAKVARFTDQSMPDGPLEPAVRTRLIEKPPIARNGSERPMRRNLVLKQNIKFASPARKPLSQISVYSNRLGSDSKSSKFVPIPQGKNRITNSDFKMRDNTWKKQSPAASCSETQSCFSSSKSRANYLPVSKGGPGAYMKSSSRSSMAAGALPSLSLDGTRSISLDLKSKQHNSVSEIIGSALVT